MQAVDPIYIYFQYILENQDGGRRLVVHELEKMAVLARFCEAFRALLVSVRDGAIHEAHRKSVQRDPSRLYMQMQLSLPVISAIDQFSCRCRAQQHRLALNQELRGCSAAKVQILAIILCNHQLGWLPLELLESIANRANPCLPRRAPAWMQQLRANVLA